MKKFSVLFTFLLFFGSIASATFISLTTSFAEITIENSTQGRVKIINSGDEAAFSLSVSLILPEGFEADKISIEKLSPNSSFEGILNITRKKDLTKGKYPAIVLTEYADANGYPFSAISPTSIIYKVNTLSKVSGSISELTLRGKESKKLILTLKNLDDAKHEVKIRLFLPRELKALEKEKTIELKEKEERKIEFEVSNFAALEGSSYVALASIEYEDNLHYSSFAIGIIKIEGEKEFLSSNKYLIFLLAFLVIIFICYEACKKIPKKKRKRS
jgi:hypothetical protein